MPSPPESINSNSRTLLFMIGLSLICALILSILASALAKPQEVARELDRSKQMMIAAKLFTHEGYFLIPTEKGDYEPAKLNAQGVLVPGTPSDIASNSQILQVYRQRLQALLTDDKGAIKTFEEAGIDYNTYVNDYRKTGYYRQPLKLFFAILPSPQSQSKDPIGYVIPVNGYGLWDAVYGYLAIKPDGITVIGTSWYDQKETPGLGANIAEAEWQNFFPGKKIFQPSSDGNIDKKTAPLGITVVRGKVSEVYGDSPKAQSAVDGMAGATLTGNGVTDAFRDVLSAYRPFFISLDKDKEKPALTNL